MPQFGASEAIKAFKEEAKRRGWNDHVRLAETAEESIGADDGPAAIQAIETLRNQFGSQGYEEFTGVLDAAKADLESRLRPTIGPPPTPQSSESKGPSKAAENPATQGSQPKASEQAPPPPPSDTK